jgi:predicted DNA-binding transcriptional regulator AlpA
VSREFPYPPRLMVRSRAAHYVDLSEQEFEREVAAGRLPLPVKLGKRDHWSRVALDECVERLAGERTSDWRDGSPLYGGKAA